jgi:hypothetical protein
MKEGMKCINPGLSDQIDFTNKQRKDHIKVRDKAEKLVDDQEKNQHIDVSFENANNDIIMTFRNVSNSPEEIDETAIRFNV